MVFMSNKNLEFCFVPPYLSCFIVILEKKKLGLIFFVQATPSLLSKSTDRSYKQSIPSFFNKSNYPKSATRKNYPKSISYVLVHIQVQTHNIISHFVVNNTSESLI